MKKFVFLVFVLLVPLSLFSQGYPEGYFYAIFRGDTFCVEPVITDSVTEAAWFDYTSSSMHTGYEAAYESHIFFFYNPFSGNIGFVVQHNIDVIGTADATCLLYLDGLPVGCSLAMSDDAGEFDLTAYPQGNWHWWDNTDGGAFYIPRDEWQFQIRSNFGSTDPIKRYYFLSGHEGEDAIYLDTVYIDQEDTVVVGHGFLELLPHPSDSIWVDSVWFASDTLIEIPVSNSDETIDTLYVTGADNTDPHFSTESTPGMLPPDASGTIGIRFMAADTGIYIDTIWAHTNEPCGTNPILLYVHCTAPPVHADIIQPLPETWTSCSDQQVAMELSTEGSMFIDMEIPSLSTTTEYFDTLTDSWVPAVNVSYSGWWPPLFEGSSWIWDSHYSGGITHRCLTFRVIIESPIGAAIDSASVQMRADNTATFYMNGDSIGADDDGATWHHLFEFDMLPSMHGGADTLTIEACDLTGVVVGLNFLISVIYRVDCLIDEASIEMSIDGAAHSVGDGALDLIDSTYLVYTPIPPDTFSDGDTITACLNSFENSCGGYLESPICWDFYVDLAEPFVSNRQPPPDSIIDDPTPTISANISDLGSGLDTSTLVFTVDGDTISPADFSLVWADSAWQLSYTPTGPIMAAGSIWVCIFGSDTTDYCPDNEMADCWAFMNMRERHVWFPIVYAARCETVLVPLLIDGLDYSWIASADMRFSVDPAILTPIGIVTDSSLTDGWAVGGIVIDSSEGTIDAHIAGSPLSSGSGGDLLFLRAKVNCNSFGGDYCPIVVDTISFNEGMPKVTYDAGLFIVKLDPGFFSCDIYLNRTVGTPTEDHVVTFGASAPASDGFDAGLDIRHIPPPTWRVNGWFDLDDPDNPLITRLMRDIRAIEQPQRWTLITDDEPFGIARWDGSSLPEGEFRMNGAVDMKRDSVCEFHRNDSLVIEWTIPELSADSAHFVRGWNLVSCPLLPTEVPPNEVFQTEIGVYRYIPPESRYAFAERIRDGEGYWVWADSAYDVAVAGGRIEGYLRTIYPGWNMIGATAEAVSVSDIASTPSGAISGDIYYYSGGGYWAADSLVPGVGYWLLATRDAVLEVPSHHSRKIARRPKIEWVATLSNENLRLEMAYAPTASDGIFGGDVAIPPPAPDTDRPAAALVSRGIEFGRKLSPSSWEIVVREATSFDLACPDFVAMRIGNAVFHNGDHVRLDRGSYKVFAENVLPKEMSIVRIEPNPFNATTNIVVAIPEKGTANIEIFDIVGKRIVARTIEMTAGTHAILWDGRDASGGDMPSGIYFVRMRLGEASSCTKALLMR